MGAIRLEILPIRFLRQPGYESAAETATAVGAVRLGIVQIHFLRQLGYENAEETAKLSLPVSAVLVGSPSP